MKSLPASGELIEFRTDFGGESHWRKGRFNASHDLFFDDAGNWYGTAIVFEWKPISR